MYTFRNKTNMVFLQIMFVAIFFVALLVYMSSLVFSQILLILQPLSHKLELICGCANHLTFSNHPYLLTGLFLISQVALAFKAI